ncbi:MAG: acylphosphatase [Candidatus Omnitrophica bacterium]|nr:acylphosphatase [Candidatus Omnitrophota bacterium]MDD5352813.1 acylphosphatase [Candidatus Omnitrophota bacterium]MDD5550412.1 acylphosphatase [Candidatus Omnitrophota bacterium]
MAKIQAHVIFKGRVQGIGFRFTAERIAADLGVKGWVKNLSDGNVEVVAESEKEIVDDFLDKVREYFQKYIQDEETDILEATGKFSDFQIRF